MCAIFSIFADMGDLDDKFCGIKTTDGQDVLTYDYVEALRQDEKLRGKAFAPQKGGQESLLSTAADITIYGGKRGGGKSYGLLLEGVKDCCNPHFNAIVVRNEISDLETLIETSQELYSSFGVYNKSKSDMTWNFNSGGWLRFSYYAGNFSDFKKRFQGKQYAYIGIDELTHIEYKRFKYLLTDNRNAWHIRNRVIGTCNPELYCWVRKYIDWWLDEDGFPRPDRNGVLRYCFMDGDSVDEIYWGNTREEVYEQCHDIIDRYWNENLLPYGTPQELFIKSVTFIEGKVEENIKLLESDPSYIANLANQSEAQRAKDLGGCWNATETSTDLITPEQMQSFFTNTAQISEHVHYMTCDPAFTGGDNCVFWIWEDWHVINLHVCKRDPKATIETTKYLMEQYKIREENFAYDLNGVGQIFTGWFKRAVKLNNVECPTDGGRTMFADFKSELAYKFVEAFIDGKVSIKPELLSRKYSGKGFKNTPLMNILLKECKCMKQDESVANKHWKLITKSEMKRLVGHSPDFWESLMTRCIFSMKKRKQSIIGLGLI